MKASDLRKTKEVVGEKIEYRKKIAQRNELKAFEESDESKRMYFAGYIRGLEDLKVELERMKTVEFK